MRKLNKVSNLFRACSNTGSRKAWLNGLLALSSMAGLGRKEDELTKDQKEQCIK